MRANLLLAGALASLSAFGATLITVSGTITDGSGNPITGSCSIVPFRPFTSGSDSQISGVPYIATITAGRFVAALAPPTDAQAAGQYYSMKCTGSTASGARGSWGPQFLLIPASSAPLVLNDVIVDLPSPTNFSMRPTQIYALGLTAGVYGLNVVNGHVTGLALCSAAPVGLSLASLTNSALLGLSDLQLLSMTN
jgi:hypothetical protein